MKFTTRFNLKKPDLTDYVSIEDLNENMDILDEALGTQLDKEASTTQKGNVQLSDATNSTSIILAATANAVKKAWDLATAKYTKPTPGIPKTDLENSVQTSLEKADSAIQSVSDASTTVKGIVMLDDAVNSTSVIKAATANAVKKVKDSVSNVLNYGIATQVEAETGTSDQKYMTPLKVKQTLTKLTPKNVPNGYAGLDENGKLLDAAIPNSVEKFVKIASFNFATDPAYSFSVTNLNAYKKVRLLGLGLGSTHTSGQTVSVHLNGAKANGAYRGSSLSDSTITNLVTSAAFQNSISGAANQDILIDIEFDSVSDNVPIRYQGSLTKGAEANMYVIGVSAEYAALNTIESNVLPWQPISRGVLEVWGVLR